MMIIAGYKTQQELDVENYEKVSIEIKAKRDLILTTIVDSINAIRWEEMGNDKKKEWKDYRQALLDIPEQSGFPFNVIWPEKPKE